MIQVDYPMQKPIEYVIWSFEHKAWWRPDRCGYTEFLDEAARYTEGEAIALVDAANQYAKEHPGPWPPVIPEDRRWFNAHEYLAVPYLLECEERWMQEAIARSQRRRRRP